MKDPLLRLIANFTDPSPGEAAISEYVTLIVNGATVNGRTISMQEFMEHHPVTQAMQRGFDEATATNPELAEPPSDIPEDERPPNFIHLADARMWAPGQQPLPNAGTPLFMRIRMADVSGWSLGQMRTAAPEDVRE